MTSTFSTANHLSEMGDALGWSILHSFADQIFNGRELSSRQLEVVQKATDILAKRTAEQKASANLPVPEGRTTVTCTVTNLKSCSFRFHAGDSGVSTSVKMTAVLGNGVRVWGTVPASIEQDVKQGDTVTFTATFTRKDAKFVTFSRPSKAVLASA
jgi:hypothetical protein